MSRVLTFTIILIIALAATKVAHAARTITISGTKTSLFGDEEMSLNATLSGFTSGETIYVKGAFYQDGTSNYFGYTKNGDSWVKNGSSTTSQRQVKVGDWDGNLIVKSDFTDSGFKGEGDYQFKVGFYYVTTGGNLSSVNWSTNNIALNINEPDPTPSPSPSPAASTSTIAVAKSPTPSPSASNVLKISPSPKTSSPEVLSASEEVNISQSIKASPSSSPKVENEDEQIPKVAGVLILMSLFLFGISLSLYFWYRKRLAKISQ